MEEEDAFIQNLASMLEVSLVEDTNSMVTLTAAEESTGNSGETKQNNISVNGVAHSAQESVSEAKSADVSCTPVEEQVKAQGAPDPDSESPSKSMLTDVPFLSENALETAFDFGHHELLTSESQSQTDVEDEEKQMYYSCFKDLKKVMYLRLHCTVCDCHIGCTPAAVSLMAFHKFLRVLICSDCENFYGNGDFACGDDGSETFCRWCGQGGQLYCCSHCPSVFCKKCIRRNLGRKTVKLIEESNEWTCYRCNVRPLWEHRALCWGLSSFLKEQSDDKTKVTEDVAHQTPGFNSLLCCEGEKLPYYRTSQPLRPIVCSVVSNTLKVKNIQSLMTPSNQRNILHNALTSGAKALEPTVPSPAIKTSSYTAVNPVGSVSSSSQPVNVVASLAKSNDEHLMLSKNPNSYNVSDSKAPDKRDGGKSNSTIFVPNNQLKLTYESVFLNHLAQSGAQSQTQNQNQRSRQNSAVPITAHVSDRRPVNVGASVPLMYVQAPSGTILMSSASISTAGPTVNKVRINQSNTSENLTCTVPALNVAPAQCIQHAVITPIPTTCYAISGGSNVIPKAIPISSFCNPPSPSSGHTQFTCPPCPNVSPQKNIVSDVQMKDISIIEGDDDDIFVVFSKVQNLTDEQNAGHEWMMKALMKTDRTSRILAYNVEVLKQTLMLRNKKKKMSTKSISHLAGKFYRLLKKASKSLNFQREFLSKEFSDWLNAEKTKRGIPTTKEREPSSSPAKDKTPDAETTEEPELLLDMEISCESDHEDVSSSDSGVQKEQIECNENLSGSETDSDDPFTDSENSNWKNVLQATSRPFLSRTVKELLRDKFSSKLLLQLLTEQHSKTADPENKQISSRKEFQLSDASTETAALGKEDLTTGKNKCNVSTRKQCAYTGVLPEQISDSGTSSVRSVQIGVGSGNENEKHVRMDSVDPISEAIQNSLMESSSSRTDDMAGSEGSHSHKTPCHNGGTSLDPISEAIQNSLLESSSSRTDDMAGSEGSNSHKTPCDNGGASLDPISEAIENSLLESSSSRTDDMAGSEGSNSHKTPCNNSGTSLNPISEGIQDSLMEGSSSRRDESRSEESLREEIPCNDSGMNSVDIICEPLQNSPKDTSTNRTDKKKWSEESCRSKTPCSNSGTSSVDPISESIQNSPAKSFHSSSDDKTEIEESQNKTPHNNGKTESGSPISEGIQISLMNCSPRIDNKSSNEGSHGEKNLRISNGMASVDRITETIQSSSVEISPSGTDDNTKNEKTPCTNGETEPVDAVSEAVHNSLMESYPARQDNKTGNEERGRGETPCEYSSIGTAQNFVTHAETNKIHTSKPLQKRTASKRSCSAVNRKRKYQCISSNDMSSDGKENSCGSGRRPAKTVRTDSPSTDPSPSSVVVPIIKLEKTEIPVNDFTALVHSAVQKKLIKPCFVSVVKLTRNN
ncbi:transcriptional regulator ATRX [Cryptotermes secundus]|nr:transcriptional regulator ATRX [Cryptotermes secundus]XP_023702254.1 transcriptional regulator ATRX [Cryptotermes secundus]